MLGTLSAQPPNKFYNKFGGFGIDIGYGVKETYNRRYIICGSTSSYGYGALDGFLMLVDSMGQKVWEKNYGGALTDEARRVVVNPADSGFVFVGHTNSMGNGGYDLWLVRTNKHGQLIWQRTFGGTDWDFGMDLILSPDGNILLCGKSFNARYGKYDAWVLKAQMSNGDLLWQKFYGGAEDDDFRSIKLTPDSKIVLTGQTSSMGDIAGDIYLFTTNLSGDSLLAKKYGMPGKKDFANDIVVESANEYILGGGTESYATSFTDAFIFKMDNLGDSIWLRNYGNSGLAQESVKITLMKNTTGRYGISYSDINFPSFKRDPKNLILSDQGYYIVGHSFGESEDEELYDLVKVSDGGFIGVGYTKSFGSILDDVFLVKYDSSFVYGGKIIGVQEINFNPSQNLLIYPTVIKEENPLCYIKCNNKPRYVNIYSVSDSRIIKSTETDEITTNLYSFSLGDLPKGIYIINFINNGFVVNFKLIRL